MKLKTLKDFDGYPTDWGHLVERGDLKQEAIKDIKRLQQIGTTIQYEEYKKLSPLFQSFYESDDDAVWSCDNLIEYIKWKNNITEEDLMTNEEINAREHGERGNNYN